MYTGFFKQLAQSAGQIVTVSAMSIPLSTALIYAEHCQSRNEQESFSNYLTFSASLIKATMGFQKQIVSHEPIDADSKKHDPTWTSQP